MSKGAVVSFVLVGGWRGGGGVSTWATTGAPAHAQQGSILAQQGVALGGRPWAAHPTAGSPQAVCQSCSCCCHVVLHSIDPLSWQISRSKTRNLGNVVLMYNLLYCKENLLPLDISILTEVTQTT